MRPIPTFLTNLPVFKRQVSSWLGLAKTGKLTNTGTVTLTPNAAQTVVSDRRVGVQSHVGLMPTTANAGAEYAAENLYVSVAKHAFTIQHSISAQTDRTFTYVILG